MATVIGDLMVPTGKYAGQDGQEKTRWLKCGIVLQTDNGMRIKMEAMPVGLKDFEGWFSVFEKENKPVQQVIREPKKSIPFSEPQEAGDDDIPF